MTTPKTATEGQLGELHQKVAKVMANALDNVITAQEAGEVMTEDGEVKEFNVNPALLSVITKFLNENKITCAPEAGNTMSELEAKLADKASRRRKVGNVTFLEDAG